ncbi:hypothetical protein EY643_02940 [Halioglobus maricola]|uniref:SGNH hydrolase-type esterase domain-containing protein n=1 Tax=Halioglobus maricola TaxID=2601894 RepID=A0A5P9NHL5_9GAMM|nr:hypothetical protein [Halioglobus maricola]QFU74694.1 hypothetical protein EY643_02940 [Halioglobus maricola]
MFSWQAIRITCMILLAIPLVHLVVLMSSDVAATLNNEPTVWADEIEDYRQQDMAGKLPEKPIVVVGGMRAKLWEGLPALLSPKPVLMRGIGDAIVEDIVYNYDDLIGYYQPETVIFLPSVTEFHIRDNKSAEDLAEGIAELVTADELVHITQHFYIISPIKTLLHPSDHEKINETMELLGEWVQRHPHVTLLDANRLLQDARGNPEAAYFRSDGSNLNEHGYLRLSTLIQNEIATTTLQP